MRALDGGSGNRSGRLQPRMRLYARSHRRAPSLAVSIWRRTCHERFIDTSPITFQIGNRVSPPRLVTTQGQRTPPPAQNKLAGTHHAELVICDQPIEEFHKALKAGCRLEERQLRAIERVWPLLGFLSIVAVRLLQIREAARCTPEATSDEPDVAVRLLAAALKTSPATVASHRDFHRGVARLGGFLARKGEGEPGWQTLWLGFERLFLLMLGAQLAAEMEAPRCG